MEGREGKGKRVSSNIYRLCEVCQSREYAKVGATTNTYNGRVRQSGIKSARELCVRETRTVRAGGK